MIRKRIKCPSCLKTKFWKTGDGRLKCKNCHGKKVKQLILEKKIFVNLYNAANNDKILFFIPR